MKRAKYTAEFKLEAVKQIIEKGHSAPEVSSRLGVPVGLLYTWARKNRGVEDKPTEDVKTLQAEMIKLKAAQANHQRVRHPKKGRRVLESPKNRSQVKMVLPRTFHVFYETIWFDLVESWLDSKPIAYKLGTLWIKNRG
jgi:transposase